MIAATLDQLEAAAAAGECGRAEQARLEAYGVFEFGPEQRLRGLATRLFRDVEGYFWYGEGGVDGLVQLVKRKASAARDPRDAAAARRRADDSEARIGDGRRLDATVDRHEQRDDRLPRGARGDADPRRADGRAWSARSARYRRPLLGGVLLALPASVGHLGRGRQTRARVARRGGASGSRRSSRVVAIGVLLLILNWFYHRVYWQENLQGLAPPARSESLPARASASSPRGARASYALGFSSVYREGFETVLFLQALTARGGRLGRARRVSLLGLAGGRRRLLPRDRARAAAPPQEDADRHRAC